MSPDTSIRKILVLAGTLLCVLALDFSACTSRLIPPSEEYLSPPEPEKVEYIAKPPSDLAKRLFSAGVSEQSREAAWSDAQGKWVVWVGNVHHVEPQLKPSRIIFLDEYETSSMSFDSGQFTVTVKFDSAWTQQLKQLTTGEFVYYRAKLVKYDLGLGSNLLTLEEGQIIAPDDVTAKLSDLNYASYDQLQRLIEDAETIANIKNYYEQKLKKGRTWIATKTVVEALTGITLNDETWLQKMSYLPDKERLNTSLKSEVQLHVRDALASLHSHAPRDKRDCLDDIGQRVKANNAIIEGAELVTSTLKAYYEEERHLNEPSVHELGLELLLLKLPKILGVTKTVLEGVIEAGKLDAYETVVGVCYLRLDDIDKMMNEIASNVVKAADHITKQS